MIKVADAMYIWDISAHLFFVSPTQIFKILKKKIKKKFNILFKKRVLKYMLENRLTLIKTLSKYETDIGGEKTHNPILHILVRQLTRYFP